MQPSIHGLDVLFLEHPDLPMRVALALGFLMFLLLMVCGVCRTVCCERKFNCCTLVMLPSLPVLWIFMMQLWCQDAFLPQSVLMEADRIDHLTKPFNYQDLREFYVPNSIPAIAQMNWFEALDLFVPEEFAKGKLGESLVNVHWGYPEQQATNMSEMVLKDYLQTYFKQQERNLTIDTIQPYAQEVRLELNDQLQAAAHQLMDPIINNPEKTDNEIIVYWLGPAGAKTGLHADIGVINVLFHLYGRKVIYLFPPQQRELLYPGGKFDEWTETSQVDPFHPDLEAFPLFAQAKPFKLLLEPGDMLFIPSAWFHYAESLSDSISVSGQSHTDFELLCTWKQFILLGLHMTGVYRPNHCTCHNLPR